MNTIVNKVKAYNRSSKYCNRARMGNSKSHLMSTVVVNGDIS